jgi:5-methylthioadenosine/S-adenosylhomocysteine deaminase
VDVYSAAWVLPVEGGPIEDGAVAVEDGRIVAVGPAAEVGRGRFFECGAIVPGFVNAHSHLEYSAYAGFGDGLEFAPWLRLHIERKRRLEPQDFVALARLGAAESLASGITTVGDASYSAAAARACDELGLRAVVHLEVFGHHADGARERFEATLEQVEPHLSERVRLGISPHAPYTCSREVYEWAFSLDLPVATHLGESEAERLWLTAGEGPMAALRDYFVPPAGRTPVRLLAEAGLLDARVAAAHCVILDDEEIELLARHDVAVVHCPRSNSLLGCGVAPLAELRAAGLRVGVGTDSPASTPSFDAFEELRAAVFAARARARDAAALSAAEALELATLGSARALGLEGEVGSLVPGKRADLAVVDLAGSPYLPWEDPAAAVVFGGSPARVSVTVVGGSLRYDRGSFEWHGLRREAGSARARMLSGVSRRRNAATARA